MPAGDLPEARAIARDAARILERIAAELRRRAGRAPQLHETDQQLSTELSRLAERLREM